ncbi:MAG TPA: hypothetical protein ENK57_25480, partial [Polyangiaceae bacterium]|nr:hypothetical protein [Polyangiaceae bacterium]
MSPTNTFVHVTVRTRRCRVLLTSPELAPWLWRRLRRSFPHALAAVLMPGHIHVLTPAVSESEARRKLGAIVSGLRRSRHPGAANEWEPASSRGTFADPTKIRRQIRYIVLNPSRAGLVRCPSEWLWSTHREVLGAVRDPWVTAQAVATALGTSTRGFAARHHRYVSGDPSVAVAGTPVPTPHDGTPTTYSLAEACAASVAAVRGAPDALTRLAHHELRASQRRWRAPSSASANFAPPSAERQPRNLRAARWPAWSSPTTNFAPPCAAGALQVPPARTSRLP